MWLVIMGHDCFVGCYALYNTGLSAGPDTAGVAASVTGGAEGITSDHGLFFHYGLEGRPTGNGAKYDDQDTLWALTSKFMALYALVETGKVRQCEVSLHQECWLKALVASDPMASRRFVWHSKNCHRPCTSSCHQQSEVEQNTGSGNLPYTKRYDY